MKSLPKPGSDPALVVRIPRDVYKELANLIDEYGREWPQFTYLKDNAEIANGPAYQWLSKPKGKELYERGMEHGFNIKRYRVSIWWEDGTQAKLMERENVNDATKYAENYIQGMRNRGYWVESNDDKPPVPCVYKSKGGDFMCKILVAVVTDNDAHFNPSIQS